MSVAHSSRMKDPFRFSTGPRCLPNPELLNALDLTLLELEKRLMRYARVGPELLEMADEGYYSPSGLGLGWPGPLLAQHTEGHLQVVGVGEWKPTSTRPAWNTEPRLSEEEEEA
jgi:hypothetical protein